MLTHYKQVEYQVTKDNERNVAPENQALNVDETVAIEPGELSTYRTLIRIFPYAKQALPRVVLGTVAALGAHLFALAIPQFLRDLAQPLGEQAGDIGGVGIGGAALGDGGLKALQRGAERGRARCGGRAGHAPSDASDARPGQGA